MSVSSICHLSALARRRGAHPDRAQVVPLIAVAILLMAGIGVLIMAVGGVVADRATARTAADAAALGAAAYPDTVESDAVAARLASANGARLISVHRHGNQVEVEVRVGRATARARAEAFTEPGHSAGGSIP